MQAGLPSLLLKHIDNAKKILRLEIISGSVLPFFSLSTVLLSKSFSFFGSTPIKLDEIKVHPVNAQVLVWRF